ncbi:hypothetical protein EI94DRAFT_1743477 [Lactarius quietus]|nr:hypothetical protein EI94DRAFT_1743477 [Lactarius quietus]
MLISIPTGTFLSYLLLISSARAQVSAPNCTDATFDWTLNSLQQSPCVVAAYLIATCLGGSLSPGYHYVGPYYPGDQCSCNTVSYSLFSACGACQGESWLSYSDWSYNCTTNETVGTFPKPIPPGTRVPKWAYFSYGADWNITLAQSVGDSPEVTGTSSISIPSITPTPLPTPTPTPTPSHTSNTGAAIAGAVVGSIVGTALIAGVVFWFVLRRRRARSVPSLDMGETEQPPRRPFAGAALRLYDPSDPTTYPIREDFPRLHSPASHTQSSGCGYMGVPEVSG